MIDFTAVAAGAVEGGAKAAGDIATGQIDKRNRIDLVREASALEEAARMRAAEAAERMRREGVLWGMSPEVTARALEVDALKGDQDLRQKVEATTALAKPTADAAGMLASAQDRAKGFSLSPGQQQFRSDGLPVAENKRLTGAEVTGDLYREGLKGEKASRDHVDENQWAKLMTPPKLAVSIVDDITGKAAASPALDGFYRAAMSELRTKRGMRADEASTRVTSILDDIKAAAAKDVERAHRADKKSPLTQEQAMQNLIGEYMKEPGANPGAKTAPNPMQGGSDRAGQAAPQASATPQPSGMIPQAQQAGAAGSTRWAQPAPDTPLEAVGQRLDAARSAEIAASQALQLFGSRQRAQDPRGYRAALDAAQAAQAARDAAERDYSAFAERAEPAVSPRAFSRR